MRKKYLSVAVVLALASSMMFSSCVGSFTLTNKVLEWNKQAGSKFVNAVIFTAFCIIPVYEITVLADALVINTIEFWSGTNPVDEVSTKIIDGKDAKYMIERNKYGYTITNLADNSIVKFNFNEADNSWALEANDTTYPLLQFVDDNHVKMIAPNNEYKTVALSNEGVLAYQELINSNLFFAQK
jgi:hypothetical protein